MSDYPPFDMPPSYDSWRTDSPPVAEPCRICGEPSEDGPICTMCADEDDEIDADE